MSDNNELRMRGFRNTDAETILSWIHDEESFRKWTADRYKDYPAKGKDMISLYLDDNNENTFFPVTFFTDEGLAGHLIMRYIDDTNKKVRLGFIIINDAMRGKGYGKKMIALAVKYAKEFLGAEEVTLGVFENNLSARRCYEACGFTYLEQSTIQKLCGQDWKCLEMIYSLR